MKTEKKFIIQAKIPNYIRPCFLNTNRTGSAWCRKSTAERFDSREAAQRRIDCPSFCRGSGVEITVIEVTK